MSWYYDTNEDYEDDEDETELIDINIPEES